jgi:hypothetical protein
MSTLLLILQCGLAGIVAVLAFPDLQWQFFAICIVNAVLTVAYGTACKYDIG